MNTQDFCFILKQNSHLLREGCFGLEKENVRVNQDGTLALTPHPAVFGDKGKHPYITTDFSESQVEMITPPLPSVGEALDLWKRCTMWLRRISAMSFSGLRAFLLY